MTTRINMNYFNELLERPLDPPDDIDYINEEELIEQARIDNLDDAWEAINQGRLKDLLDLLPKIE